MVLFDTPGVISKKRHKLDEMMMQNVRTAAINADCVLVIVDACQIPEKVSSFRIFDLSGLGITLCS